MFLIEFFDFIKKPYFDEDVKIKYKNLIFHIFFLMIFSYSLVALIFLLISHLGVKIVPKNVFLPKKNILLLTVVFFPIIEEFLFRSILRKGKYYFYFFLFALVYAILLLLKINFYISIAVSLFLTITSFFLRIKIPYYFIKKNMKPILIITNVLFAIIHLYNFNIPASNILILFIIIFQKFIGGIYLSFICVRYGLVFSILFHSLYNGLPHIIKYFS